MEGSLGPGALVRKMDNFSVVELRDIDSKATAGEILDAISREMNASTMDSRVINIRKVYGGRNQRSSKSKYTLPDRQTSGRTSLHLKRADRTKKELLSAPIIWARISELQGYGQKPMLLTLRG